MRDTSKLLKIRCCVLLLSFHFAVDSSAESQIGMQFPEPTRFLVAHGRRAWAGGYANAGLEVWAGALQLVTDVRPEFRRCGDVTPIPGPPILSKVDVEPTHIARTYTGPDFSVEEEVWIPLDRPAALIRYSVHGARPVRVIVHLRPSLNLMWPAALGGQEIVWSASQSGYALTDSARQFAAVVLAPGATAHDEPLNSARELPQSDELAVELDGQSPQILFTQVHAPALQRPVSDAEFLDARRLLDSSAWQQESLAHYDKVLSSNVQIETPDARVNQALTWAKVALDQAWFCNDALGCGYAAGFGPSRRNRRPQYAWFFANDGMVDAQAATAVGDLEHAREELRFIAKYQDSQSGTIWHELSQSAPYIAWREKYPYMFVHADLNYPYISAVADYIRASNDRSFLQEIWPSVEKAFIYGRSLIGPDGLPRIPEGTEGADEQNQLSDELGLSANWIAACNDYAHLAQSIGHGDAAREARSLADKARLSFDQRYWDTQRNFAVQGYRRNGEPVHDRAAGAIAVVPAHLLADPQRNQILDAVASWQFQSDWGVRSVAMGEPGFDPTGYAHGSVWALSTGEVSQAYWQGHRPDTAWQIWRTLLSWAGLDSPGHMHEVLAGDTYHPQLESVPEQTWSSAVFLSAGMRGLIGLNIDAENGTVNFVPHLPADWDHLAIRGIRIGDSKLNFAFEQNIRETKLHIENTGQEVRLRFRPQIPLGSRVTSATVSGHKVAVHAEQFSQDMHAALEFLVPPGHSEVSMRYRGGLALIMPEPHPSPGEASTGMKLTSVSLAENQLHLGLDIVPSVQNLLQIRTERRIQVATGAEIKSLANNLYELTIPREAVNGSAAYQRHQVTVTLAR